MSGLGLFYSFSINWEKQVFQREIPLIIRLVIADTGDELPHGGVSSSINLEGSLMKAQLLTATAR